MEIRVDDNGNIRLVSNKPLTAEIVEKIEKRLDKKQETLNKMMSDYKEGKFDAIFKTF